MQKADMSNPESVSQHGCAIVLGARGLIVLGPSGSGKSRLCHLLVERRTEQNLYARWVADDRFFFEEAGEQVPGDKLIVRSPDSIAGLAERRFRGIEPVSYQTRAVVDLVVQLELTENLERLPDSSLKWTSLGGVELPLIKVPCHPIEQAIELVETHLKQN